MSRRLTLMNAAKPSFFDLRSFAFISGQLL